MVGAVEPGAAQIGQQCAGRGLKAGRAALGRAITLLEHAHEDVDLRDGGCVVRGEHGLWAGQTSYSSGYFPGAMQG
jgi:hypothetical protein